MPATRVRVGPQAEPAALLEPRSGVYPLTFGRGAAVDPEPVAATRPDPSGPIADPSAGLALPFCPGLSSSTCRASIASCGHFAVPSLFPPRPLTSTPKKRRYAPRSYSGTAALRAGCGRCPSGTVWTGHGRCPSGTAWTAEPPTLRPHHRPHFAHSYLCRTNDGMAKRPRTPAAGAVPDLWVMTYLCRFTAIR
jgi:hypothetical protein